MQSRMILVPYHTDTRTPLFELHFEKAIWGPELSFKHICRNHNTIPMLKKLMGDYINPERFATINERPTIKILASNKEELSAAINLILTSEHTFLDLTNEKHQKAHNDLIKIQEDLGFTSQAMPIAIENKTNEQTHLLEQHGTFSTSSHEVAQDGQQNQNCLTRHCAVTT